MDIKFSLMCLSPIVESESSCLHDDTDEIIAYTEDNQHDHNTVLIPPDEVDNCGGTVYVTSQCDNSDNKSPDYESYNNAMGTKHIQRDHDTVLDPPNEVDNCAGAIYVTSQCNNPDIPELKENKYYPWINHQEFWITE